MSPENIHAGALGHIPTGVLVPESVVFTFSLDSFRITDTRSRHEDTDYAVITLQLKSAHSATDPQTLTKKIGDVNNGTHAVGLSFPNIHIDPSQTVVFNYIITNSGHKDESAVYQTLEKAGTALANKALVAGGTALGNAIPLPGIGPILGAAAGWLASEIGSILTANCDGPVAAEQITLTYADLVAKTANGTFSHETKQPGTDSATGCGSNSMYYVDWHITKTTVPGRASAKTTVPGRASAKS
jgi:hypothetical protein